MARNLQRAFSLIELAIVLAVISILITLGITSQSIVKNYEIKKVMNIMNDYANASKAYYQIYNVLPGDSDQGHRLFGDSICTNNTINDSNSGCNGDADQQADIYATGADSNELILAYYQLYRAELLKFNNQNIQNIDNVDFDSSAVNCSSIPVQRTAHNIPALGIRDAGVFLEYIYGDDGAGGSITDSEHNSIRFFVAKGLGCTASSWNPVFSAEEMAAIDHKYDNGIYNSGNIWSEESSCSDTAYKISEKNISSCYLRYKVFLANKIY